MTDPDRSRDPGGIAGVPPGTLPFVEKIGGEFRGIDLASLAVPTVALVGVFGLSPETRLALAFQPGDPTVQASFVAHYVHLTVPHLLSNLLMYLTLASVAYLLSLSNGHRSRLYAVLGLVLLAFPVVLSYLNAITETADVVVGFSGLNMAFLGFVTVEFAAFVDEHFTDAFGVENAPALFFPVTAFVAARYAESTAGLAVLVVSLGLAAAYSVAFLSSARPSLERFLKVHDERGYFELLVATSLLLVAFVPASFPRNPVTESGTVSLTIHLLGFSLGFLSVYAWVMVATSAELSGALPTDP